MNNTRATLLVMTLVFVFIKPSRAQEQNCKEIGAAAQMARAKTTRAVNDARKQAGESYLARLVFAYRFFHLHPKSKAAAESLLSLIPADNTQQKIVLTLGDSLCDEESVADIKVLARVNEGLAQGLAAAVLLSPRFLSSYVSYSTTATEDPHSDYAVHMKKVCREAHGAFTDAVKQLSQDQQTLFAKHVLNPSSCAVLAVPESDR